MHLDDDRCLPKRHDWRLDGLSVEVDYDTDATPRRVNVRVNLPAGLADEQITRLRRVADACPVRCALDAGFVFDEHMVVAAPDRRAA